MSYLITGGTGGIGQSLTRWMSSEGAKYIILASRSGQNADDLQSLIKDLENVGTRVDVQKCDVAQASDVDRLLKCITSEELPPLAGVIHGAMALKVCAEAPKQGACFSKNFTGYTFREVHD